MVALDGRRISSSALNHIWVNGALAQKFHGAQLFGLCLKGADKALADNFALLFRIRHTFQVCQKLRSRIDANQVHIKLFAKHMLDLIPLIFAQHSVVYKNAGQIFANCFVYKYSCN